MNGKPEKDRRITPKGEALEDTRGGRFPPVAVGIIIIAFLIMNSVKIVDAGNRGVYVFEHEI